MSPLEPLPPDQRAVVALVLQQGRSYDEIAALLGMPVGAVRARAQAGLSLLARDNGLPDEITGPLADYLLGQQTARDAEGTCSLLAESAPARAWATDVAASLEDVAPSGLPAIQPGASGAPGPPREAAPPAAAGDSPPAASRLGGVLLIAAVLAVVAVVLYLALNGGDDPGDKQGAASPAPATPSPTATPQVADTIPLRPVAGGNAKGTMTLFLHDGRLLFALEARDVAPSGQRGAYAVWFTGPGDKARRLGFTNPVGEAGRLGIQGPSEKDLDEFPQLYATYERVVVSRENSEDARRPSKVVLSGKLPKGR